MATDEAVVICGHSSILLKDLRKAALCLLNKLSLDLTLNKERLRQVWVLGDLSYTNLPGIISYIRPCRCSNPQDRIFAVLSFLRSCERDLNITPDYSMSTAELFQEIK